LLLALRVYFLISFQLSNKQDTKNETETQTQSTVVAIKTRTNQQKKKGRKPPEVKLNQFARTMLENSLKKPKQDVSI